MKKNKFHLSSTYIFLIALGLIAIVLLWMRDPNGSKIATLNNLIGNDMYPVKGLPTNTNNGYPAPLSSPQPISSIVSGQYDITEAAKETQFAIGNVFPSMTAAAQALISATVTPSTPQGGCFTDQDKQYFSLLLPPGWHGYGDHGSYTIANYTQAQLTAGKVDPVKTLWIEIQTPLPNNNMSSDELLKSRTDLYKVQPAPYHIGRYNGYQFDFNNHQEGAAMEIILSIKDSIWLVIGIGPGNSQEITEGLSILSTLDDSASCPSQPGASVNSKLIPVVYHQNENNSIFYQFACPVGTTFPGNEAPNSTIKLEMPFRAGQSWVVGGQGSFYGNNHHCNYYNNYYATDWNEANGNTDGQGVLAIADGIVSAVQSYPCPPYDQNNDITKYGCYVQIDNSYGYRMMYAHMMK